MLAAPADRLRALMDERPGFRRRLLALTHFYQAQANQLAVCNAFHRIEPRVARWILTTEDLTGHRIHDVTQDEIAGYLVTMAFHTPSFAAAVTGFVLFRIFDIAKPPPLRWIERRFSDGRGVVLDDVAAGIYANIALIFFEILLPTFGIHW